MSQYLETTKVLTIGVGASDRIWAAPSGVPVQKTTVWVQAKALSAVDIDYEVFLGGYFTVAAPFTSGATHSGGVSQGAAAAVGGASTELCHKVFDDASHFPINNPNSVSFPAAYVTEFTNNSAGIVELHVTFIQQTIGSNV